MATTKWRGDAQPIRQIQKVSVTNVGVGDVFKITCNRKVVSFTATEATSASVYAGLTALLGEDATIPEFTEITPLGEYLGDTDGLWLQGPEDGTPFTVTVSKVNGTPPGVVVTTITDGSPGTNCQQTVTVTATGGTFTLSFLGVVTGNIAYNASAATVETALEGLTSIGSGNVNVTDGGTSGNQRSWVAEFVGPFAYTTQPLMVANGGNLTGLVDGIENELQAGYSGSNHQYEFTLRPRQGTITWRFRNPNTGAVSFATSNMPAGLSSNHAAIIQSSLSSMPSIGAGNVQVTRTAYLSGVGQQFTTYQIEFVGLLAQTDVTPTPAAGEGLSIDSTTPSTYEAETEYELTETQQGGTTGQNEIQTFTFDIIPSGGTWTLTYSGQTTAALAYNISAAALQTALEALSNIAPGEVIVTDDTTPAGQIIWTVEFDATKGDTNQPMMIMTTTSLTGGPASVALTQEGLAGAAEVQEVSFNFAPDGGTFTLTYDGQTTGNIAWNAAASVVQTTLEALSNIANGDVFVAGAPAGPYTVTFQGALAYTNVVEMTGDGANLTTSSGTEAIALTDVVSPTGPNWYSEATNWTGNAIPSSADVIIFEDSEVDCLYGILPSSIPQSMTIRFNASYTGKVGLPEWNGLGYYEYRDKRLRIGDTSGTVTLVVGQGDGDGSSRIRMNTGAATTGIDVWATDQADTDDTRAFDWIGTHASNAIRVHDGQVAIAPYDSEAATFATLVISENGNVLIGPGATTTAITTLGDLLTRAPLVTSLTINDGTCISYGILNSATIVITGGTWEAHNSGTALAVTVGPGDIDCSDDYTAKTFTTFTIKAGGSVDDPNKTITATSFVRGTDVREFSMR